MTRFSRRPLPRAMPTALACLGLWSLPVAAAEDPALNTRALAATCAHCHGTDGKAVDGTAFARLAGMPKDYMLAQMAAFRSGERKATVMHQLVKGYTPAQLELIATYFSNQR